MLNALTWSLFVFGLLGLAWLGVGWLVAREMLIQTRNRCEGVERPEDRGIPTERFEIPFDDDHVLSAWALRPDPSHSRPAPCVVMVHGFSSHKDCLWTFDDEPDYRGSMLDQGAQSLWEAGFCVVAIDLRNHGCSDTHGHVTLGQDESEDVLCTVRYLVENAGHFEIDADRIGLRGESMGAVTCLIAGSSVSPSVNGQAHGQGIQEQDVRDWIQAIWCDSPFADARRVVGDFLIYSKLPRLLAPAVRFWLRRVTRRDFRWSSSVEYVAGIDRPVFLVHSQDDNMIPADHLDELLEAEWAQNPEVWRLDRHRHNRLWKEPGYHRRQIDFFQQHLAVQVNDAHSSQGSSGG